MVFQPLQQLQQSGYKLCYIGSLPPTATAEALRAAFIGCGEIPKIKIAEHRINRRFAGFAFLAFWYEEHMNASIKMDGMVFDGRKIIVRKAIIDSNEITAWIHWNPPTGDMVIINTDGAYNEQIGRGGYGYILRRSSGEFIYANAAMVTPSSVIMHELQGIEFGVGFAKDRGYKDVLIQSDSGDAVSYINEPANCPEDLREAIERVRALKEGFSSIQFEPVYREANRPADLLSRQVNDKRFPSKSYNQMIDLPSEIAGAVREDALNGVMFTRKFSCNNLSFK